MSHLRDPLPLQEGHGRPLAPRPMRCTAPEMVFIGPPVRAPAGRFFVGRMLDSGRSFLSWELIWVSGLQNLHFKNPASVRGRWIVRIIVWDVWADRDGVVTTMVMMVAGDKDQDWPC